MRLLVFPIALVGAMLMSAIASAQTVNERVVVKRPDGTLVERIVGEADEQQGWRARASAARAEETERLRLEMQQSKEARIEQSLREREAALQNPARQIPPTIGR